MRDHLFLWNGMLLYLSHGEHSNDWHSHYAASLLISVDAPFELQIEDARLQCQVALLSPNTENRINMHGRWLDIMIDPDSTAYTGLHRMLDGSLWSAEKVSEIDGLKNHLHRLFTRDLSDEQALKMVYDIIECISGERPATQRQRLDHRINKALDLIRESMPEDIEAESLAETIGLSRSRLLHLFREQLGLPIGQYMLWRRLYESVRLWDEGMSMTDAAHAAGFYDQSHYTRTMRRMLDVAPSQFANNPNLEIHHCWRNHRPAAPDTVTE